MSIQSFVSDWKYTLIFLIVGLTIGIMWYIFIGHDAFLGLQTSEKNLVGIVDSSHDCSFLRMFYGDAKDKWVKSSDELEAIKRMEVLKC